MSVCSPVCLSSINAIVLKGRANLLLSSNSCGLSSQGKSNSCSIHLSPGKFVEVDAYVSQIRKPHVWGGEPELLIASHVLQMPITVYMYDKDAGGLISIAKYGQEYGKENPIRVLYHGFGHYDALEIPGKGLKSRL
ncbi:hypothetical protein K1719_034565 [Acacia pycnantha]|nr:hypothetical protein K1719_034565 [Acacia pycnantha]